MVLVLLNLLLEIADTNLVILDDQVDLKLLDTITDLDKLVSTPNETLNFNRLDVRNEIAKMRLVFLSAAKIDWETYSMLAKGEKIPGQHKRINSNAGRGHKLSSSHGFTSMVTIDLAAGLVLPCTGS